jgi:predicted AAA+ superfamily ATPase
MAIQRPLLARHIAPRLEAALDDTPVVLVVGPRQSGKTTLCGVVGRKRGARFLSLDDAATSASARTDPAGFVASLEGPTILDEIQNAPELLRSIKLDVDRRREPGRFLLTGSADVLALPRVSESLAGRMEVLTLWPLSQGEIAQRPERFIDAAFGGSRPSIAPGAETRK